MRTQPDVLIAAAAIVAICLVLLLLHVIGVI
jgi:hypothetical protein